MDSDVWYADGTYGDTDHRTHALQYIRYVILMELGWNGESDSLCETMPWGQWLFNSW